MYQSEKIALTKISQKYILYKGDDQLRFNDFLTYLQEGGAFRSFFIELLSDVSFRAYHWETPPLTSQNLNQPFEFVVTRSLAIDLPPDPGPFQQYFNPDQETVVFNNLGNDAKLIAPTPKENELNYSHITMFTSEAPENQQHALWQKVGQATKAQISDSPLWLNTAGGGVAWLHIRLDSRPKYYRHQPYTTMG